MRGSEYSLSDIAAATGNNNNGGFGHNGDWAWIIVLFLIFGYGRGFGGFGGNSGSTSVYEGYVLNNDFSQLSKQISDTYNLTDRKFDAITNGICNLGYTQAQLINGIDKSILTTSNQTNANISNLGYNLQNCCCKLESQLADNKYEMAYKFYNANPRNNNTTDCFIRSLSCATDKSWDYTYDKISNLSQWNGTTMDNRDFIIEYLDRNFKRMPKFNGTIGEASDFYENNIILITTPGHIVCSKYGILYDTWDSSNRFAEFIWKIK